MTIDWEAYEAEMRRALARIHSHWHFYAERAQHQNIFADDILADVDRVSRGRADDGTGYFFETRCAHCGVTNGVTLPWRELVPAAFGRLPLDRDSGKHWAADGIGSFLPVADCSVCRQPLGFAVTQAECIQMVLAEMKQRGALETVRLAWQAVKRRLSLGSRVKL